MASLETQPSDLLMKVIEDMLANLDIKDRTYHFKTYKRCFVGTEAVDFFINKGYTKTEVDAVALGNAMLNQGYISHVVKEHTFKNEYLFYRFKEHEEFHGGVAQNADGSNSTWADFLLSPFKSEDPNAESLQAKLPAWDHSEFKDQPLPADVGVSPLDAHNVKLLDNVHPAKWVDPVPPDTKYNLVVIGAGPGGLVSAAGTAGVGGKVALIESHLLGGDCLNVGCVPSKAVIRCAKVAHEARHGAHYGVTCSDVKVDFGAVMERMRKLRADMSPNDSAQRFTQELGIDVYQGHGHFTGPNTIEVNGKTLKFAAAVIAVGARAAVPPIKGLETVPYLTNHTFFNLTELPARFGVIGTGPIGLELAQSMQRFGSAVTVFGRSGRILEKEDDDAAAIIKEAMVKDGLRFMLKVQYQSISKGEGNTIVIKVKDLEREGVEEEVVVDALLVATGRQPNVEKLGLELAGVQYHPKDGIVVNDLLQTSVKHIYAVGDCCTAYKFTHVADFMARLVIRNALFFGKGKMSSLLIPWATYTEPEVAHVGLYEKDLEQRGIKYDTFIKHLEDNDRAICDGQTEGFVKIHTRAGSDEILGATIVADGAGSMISEITVAMQSKMGLASLAYVIHPYPTQAEAVRQCGDLYNKTRLTPAIKAAFRNLLAFRRS